MPHFASARAWLRWPALLLFVALQPGCAAANATGPSSSAELGREPAPTMEQWRWARQRLADLKAKGGTKRARTLRIALALREPYTGRTLEARGAVALQPPRALRMILLGPGGTTALDLWSKDDRFRFEVPAIDLLRRGDARTPRSAMRGLPVGFLRWWLLRPLEGQLVWHRREVDGDRFVLRDGDALIRAHVGDDGRITARRSTPSSGGAPADEESVTAARVGCGTARYTQRSTGLDVVVRCEAEETSKPPDPRAFEDPDAGTRRAEPRKPAARAPEAKR
jgi:hypothetical protein